MPSAYIIAEDRRLVIARAQGRCEYCLCWVSYATESFAVEHIIPVARGGASALDNLAFACSGCNGHKYNKVTAIDALDGKEAPLFHPRRQRWQDHFEWSEDYLTIVGLTPTGRATITALHVNRPGVVNLRGLLYLAGKHPPSST